MLEALNYPFDDVLINRKKKALKRLLSEKDNLQVIKLAVMGGSTTFALCEFLEIFALKNGFKLEIYQSEYGKFYEEIMFDDAKLVSFKPDVFYIHTNIRNLNSKFKPPTVTSELVDEHCNYFHQIWKKIADTYQCSIIQNNFELPPNGRDGIYDNRGINKLVNAINERFEQNSSSFPNLIVNDLHGLSAMMGLDEWHDLTLWYSYKYAMSYRAFPRIANALAIHLRSIYGAAKKCLVLDLDDTLWSGVIGEVGVNGIELGEGSPVAEAHLAFQKYIVSLKDKGVILAVCSKNDEATAKEGFQHPESVLSRDDFAVFKANWDSKDQNIRDIAKTLNISLDSMVFIDDNPAERELVKQSLPMVEVPNIGDDISQYIHHVDKNGYFDSLNLSEEDSKRNEFYKAEIDRSQCKSTFNNYEDYLESLKMKADISLAGEQQLKRITQLINKTNQFNLTTKRVTETEIKECSIDSDRLLLYGQLEDRFGDNGIVTSILGEIKNDTLEINIWVMSCRVFKRTLEHSMFDKLLEYCKDKNIKKIIGDYIPSKKNIVVKDLYPSFGFKLLTEKNGTETWCYEIQTSLPSLKLNIQLK
jgi:FkbH-like protein